MDLALGFKTERRLAIGLLLMLFQALLIADALAGQCLKDTRPVNLEGGQNDGAQAVQLRRYLCETSNADQISIQLNRLNDLSASLFVHGKVPSILRPVFANSKIVNNEILREFKRLLNNFGNNENIEFASFKASSVTGEHGESTLKINTRVPVLVENHDDNHPHDFLDPAAIIKLENEKTVPVNYTKVNDQLIWRYMTTKDLAQYRNTIDAYNRLIARYSKNNSDSKWIDPSIRLYRQLAKSGWPSDFIVVIGKFQGNVGCGSGNFWNFLFFPRHLVLDVAVIENVSSRRIDIDALIGNASENRALRRQELSIALSQGQQHEMAGLLGSLAPGEKLVVPIRMTFVIPDGLRETFKGCIDSLPTMTNYVWGPEIVVTGIKVNGEAAMLETSAANYLALVTSCECGSCPYLYVWDDDAERWRNQGKIIHKADGLANEMAEMREFDGLVSRFQIIEQEAELAFINSAALELEFVDGSLKTVPLNHQAVKDTDNLYQELYFGDVLDLAFNLPGDIDPAKVKHSRLKVTGYYRRYGDILSETMTGPNRNDASILRAVQR